MRLVRLLARALPRCLRLRSPHYFLVAGLVFAAAILAGTMALLRYEKEAALAAEAERGRLIANTLDSHVSLTLDMIDNALNSLIYILEHNKGARFSSGSITLNQDMQGLIASTTINSTYLRSLSVMDADGRVLISSSPKLIGQRFSLAVLGFNALVASALEPGRPQSGRDLDGRVLGLPALDGPYAVPFGRGVILHGQPLLLLAMVNPSALFPDNGGAPAGTDSYAALFDYHGNLLCATHGSGFSLAQSYAGFPMFRRLRRDMEIGSFSIQVQHAGRKPDDTIASYRATSRFPVVSIVGTSTSQLLARFDASTGRLQWFGFAAALVVLLFMSALWRIMLHRENIGRALTRAKEAAERATAARGAFLSAMSHEIRTPMNAVIGMASMLRETQLDAEQDDFAKIIEESATALMAIIDDILDFSKIDAGKLEIESIDCHLLQIVEGSMDVLAIKARAQGLRLMSFVDPRLPPVVAGDPGRVRQILLNLIGNAVKFTAAGEICISVRAVDAGGGQQLIRFEVRDTGIGIEATMLAALFNPFTQADGSITRKYGGTGLGLSICKRLVELMGGTIGAESVPGTGSFFWFDLPMRAVNGQSPSLRLQAQAGTSIVVVEPNQTQADILRDYALSWGMLVRVTSSAAAALALPPAGTGNQVVIVDSRLVDMAVGAFVDAMAARAEGMRFVLVADTEEARLNATRLGFHAALTSPIRQSALFDAIAVALERRRSDRSTRIERRVRMPAVDAAQALRDRRLILLVDDNAINQMVGLRQLARLGYAAHVVNSGQEALDALAHTTYALVLMDCQMPVMDGYEAVRRIRQRALPGGIRVQIVAMTANAMRGDRERCFEAGMDDYLAKPIQREQLAAVLAQRLPLATPITALPPVLDLSRLDDVFGDDHVGRLDMLKLYVTTARTLLAEFAQAIDVRDLAAVSPLAHRLFGSSANVGVDLLAAFARDAERAALAADFQRLKQVHGDMLPVFARLCEAVDALASVTTNAGTHHCM